ncbi:MAG: toxin-antitoxin system HicB family antitoxin [Anaerovoracaceae bacterium]
MPKSLHRTLSEQASAEGISMNQYCFYLLAMNSARQRNSRGRIRT